MNNPEIRQEQVLNNPELQPPVGIDQVTAEQQASLTPDHNLMGRIRESKLLVGATTLLAAGAMAVGASSQVEAKGKFTNRYQDKNQGVFFGTKITQQIERCQDMNVSFRRWDNWTQFKYPYGSIESQRISTKVGKKSISVVTKLRDTNLDSDVDHFARDPRDGKSEFSFGCSYLTDSNTTLNLRTRKSKAPISAEKIISYQENPRIFHQKRFVTKTFKTKLNLPKKLTKRDLKKGTYCVNSKQFSESIARPFNVNAIDPSTGRLIDPSQNTGMLREGYVNPAPKFKTYKKCITKTKQYTLKPAKDSPWTHYPY